MGLVMRLCSELSIPIATLARIVGLPAEQVEDWSTAGVPLSHHVDFRVLEDVMMLLRTRSQLPLQQSLQLRLAVLEDRSIIEALEALGPLAVHRLLEPLAHFDPTVDSAAETHRPAA